MSYDIPPELHHKEKIIFGLTFSQLAYAIPFALLILVILLKSGLDLKVSGILCIPIIFLAGFFMFFNGKDLLLNLIKHYRNPEIKVNSKQLKNIIDIKEIKHNYIKTKSYKIAIIEVIPLNFLIRTEEEKESIIIGFQKFLNGLDFPIQIQISTDEINLKNHFDYIKSKNNELFQSYKDFILKTIKENNIKNRKFYILIKEKEDLDIQVKICEDKLKSLGLKVKRLNEKELLNLFKEYITDKKDLKENEVLENPTQYLLSPNNVKFYTDYFELKNKFNKVIAVIGYPHSVESDFLNKIISNGDNYDISIHIEPYPIDTTMIQLNKELQKQQSDLYSDSKKGIINPSLEIKYKSTRNVLEDLQKGKQKLFNVSLYLLCKGKNKHEINLLSKKVKSELDSLMIQSKVPKFQVIDSYSSILPLCKDELKIKRNVHTTGLSAFFPFSSPFLDIDDNGILLGFNKNMIPYIKNIFSLTNANGVILATSGAGKSYFTKLLISRLFLSGCDVIIIDPQGEYLAITGHYQGEVITISKTSDTIINPLDLMGHDYLEKRLSLMDLFQIMFGELTEIQKAILDKAVDLTYARKNINRDSWKGKTPPKMQDLFVTLLALERRSVSQEKVTYRALLNRLLMYTEKGVFSFLNKDTNIDFSKDFVCFNIGAMPKQVKPVVMYLVLDFVYMRMKDSLKRKILVIDEAWSLLQTAEESSYIFEIVKTCRKHNLGLLMITQDVADLVGSKAGHAVLANTSYTFLLRQKPAVISNVSKTFNLSLAEKEFLITANKGEGILILENEHQELKVLASSKEHELITTNPDEIIQKNKPQIKVQEDVNITLDIEQDVHSAWDKSIIEKNFLANNGYALGSFHNLEKGRQKEYFVKIRKPEGALHTYYVDLIYQEIRKHTDNVWKNRTELPDIVFINKNGEEIAIEVETGIKVKYQSKKDYHEAKFVQRKKVYGNKCYIFLSFAPYKNSYLRHELPILLRQDTSDFVKSQFSEQQKSTIVQKSDFTN